MDDEWALADAARDPSHEHPFPGGREHEAGLDGDLAVRHDSPDESDHSLFLGSASFFCPSDVGRQQLKVAKDVRSIKPLGQYNCMFPAQKPSTSACSTAEETSLRRSGLTIHNDCFPAKRAGGDLRGGPWLLLNLSLSRSGI